MIRDRIKREKGEDNNGKEVSQIHNYQKAEAKEKLLCPNPHHEENRQKKYYSKWSTIKSVKVK